MDYILHQGDLPPDVKAHAGDSIAVDTETLGLRLRRDRLCLVQLRLQDGGIHLVQLRRPASHASARPEGGAGGNLPPKKCDIYDAPNLKALLADPQVLKLFHYARFDLAMIRYNLGVFALPAYCTKIASKLARTYTDRHGLKELLFELLDIDISKQQQSSDWGAARLSREQLVYAGTDVAHLHQLRDQLHAMLVREGREELAQRCFDFLRFRVELDLSGWAEQDIFSH